MDPSSSLVPLVVGDGSSSSGSEDEASGTMVTGGDLLLRSRTTSAAARAITDNANRSSSQLTAQMIMQKGKYGVAMFITNELAREKLQLATTTTTTTTATSAASAVASSVPMMVMSSTTGNPSNIVVTATTGGTDVAVAAAGATGGTGRKPISTDLHRSVGGGTVPKQQYHPLDMTIGGGTDVAKMDSVNVEDLEGNAEDSTFVIGMDSDETFTGSHYLNLLLDDLLMPDKRINDPETIDWCKWLIAGGRIPEDFAQIGEWSFVLCC